MWPPRVPSSRSLRCVQTRWGPSMLISPARILPTQPPSPSPPTSIAIPTRPRRHHGPRPSPSSPAPAVDHSTACAKPFQALAL